MKWCNRCGQMKPRDEFHRHASNKDGLSYTCKPCVAERTAPWREANRARRHQLDRVRSLQKREEKAARTRQWRSDNRDRHRASVQAYRHLHPESTRLGKVLSNHRRRATLAQVLVGVVTAEGLAAKADYWGQCCWLCGGPWSQWDHVIPLAASGPHVLANLRPACGPCNNRKNRFRHVNTGRRRPDGDPAREYVHW